MLVVGGKDGYVERDGHMADADDAATSAGVRQRRLTTPPAHRAGRRSAGVERPLGLGVIRLEAQGGPGQREDDDGDPGTPSTSVCSAIAATAATDDVSHADRRHSATSSASHQATSAASPSSPVSTPISV